MSAVTRASFFGGLWRGASLLGALLLSLPAHAETLPAIYSPVQYTIESYKAVLGGHASPEAACEAGRAWLARDGGKNLSTQGTAVWINSCALRAGVTPKFVGIIVADVDYGYLQAGGTQGHLLQYVTTYAMGYTCPDASWTLAGTTCTRPDCAAGQFRDAAGVCRDTCPAGTTWAAAAEGCACPL